MDILHLVDRLEELFNESRPIPFTKSVIVNEERMLEIIDQMRISIPEEIKKAQQTTSNRDRILAQAQEEANRTLSLARDNRDQMLERDAYIQMAHTKADEIEAQGKQEADEYALQTLNTLLQELVRLTNQVQNGIGTLQNPLQEENNEPADAQLEE